MSSKRPFRSALRVAAFSAACCVRSSALAQAPVTAGVSVDATQTGTPLERVWPYYGYDEVNYTTTPAGQALLQDLAKMHAAPVYVRTHFLLNSGDGTASLKWGSTNLYTEVANGSPVYSFNI